MIENLSKEQADAMLDALPFEISFVDDQDNVRYFNKVLKRDIFQRPPTTIGRNVRQCHPEKSLSKVLKILDDFKAGKRDHADFWIDFRGMKVLIRYFAVRDRLGKYLGCLETSQDIAPLQKIEGEKRLDSE